MATRIHADLSLPAIVNSAELPWIPSPQPGVERRMLDREGDEVARATSLVRYAPDSHFPTHVHGGGEEFLVLDGVFSDEHGDYPAGTYVRNPPGSSHAPFTCDGCVILVKLRQMRSQDEPDVVIRPGDLPWANIGAGVQRQELFRAPWGESVALERMIKGASIVEAHESIEIYVLEGSLQFEDERLDRESWQRFPAGANPRLTAATATTIWVKRAHLPCEPVRQSRSK